MEGYLVGEPRPLGLSAAIAVGTHTSIVDIIAPASANAGDLVNVEVRVRNISTETIAVSCATGLYDETPLYFSPDYLWAEPGSTQSFTASFTMPNNDVSLHVGSFYWTETGWVQDDYAYVDITLAGVPPAAGTISEMELEYDESRAAIPAYDVPQGQRGLVHIWGRNDTDGAQQMGISWIVRDPDGITVEQYSTWEAWPYTGAGKKHEFIGGRFDLDKIGTYLLDAGLFMNPDEPIMVDEYRGVLCTAQEVAPELETLEVRIDPAGAGYVTVSPEPVGGVEHNWLFPHGTIVYVTAHPNPGYVFDSWSGEMTDTKAITAPVYPMTEHRRVTAHFKLEIEPEEYELIQHTIFPYAYIYDGDVEVTTATFKTDPFTPPDWMGDKFASKLEEEVRARGGRPIEVKVYADTTPLLWTNFRVEVTGTPLGGAVEAAPGVSVGIPVWLAIILVCLAIIAVIIVVTLAIKTITEMFKHKPGLEDVKPGWGKETLMGTIHDSEEYWERPLTPLETLEGMSEQELRDHLDQIAEEEVKPEFPWPLVIVGGVCALAAIGLAAYGAAPRRKKE